MSFRLKLIYFLVHTLKLSNREAKRLLQDGKVRIGELVVSENTFLPDDAAVWVNEILVRPAIKQRILLFNKPRGYESTLSEKVPDNLSVFFEDAKGLIIAGRLDKDSEGLLLLSNDGKWVENICRPDNGKEKEYVVELDKNPDNAFFEKFRAGVRIGNYMTRTCQCDPLGDRLIRVVLKEGKNRQIRRMCRNLGFDVVSLKRTRIDRYMLDGLLPGHWRDLSSDPSI